MMPFSADAVGQLMEDLFDDEKITSFCFDHCTSVYKQFTSEMSRLSKIKMVLADTERRDEFGRLLTQIGRFFQFRGYDILSILYGFSLEAMEENVQHLYEIACKRILTNPNEAIRHCKTALKKLRPRPSGEISDVMSRFHLLLGATYLNRNQNGDLDKAGSNFWASREAYHLRQWKHLESLSYLGLAIVLRQSQKPNEALRTCHDALECLKYDSIQDDINDLREAINVEVSSIELELPPEAMDEDLFSASSEEPVQEASEAEKVEENEKKLPLFDALTGKGTITGGGVTDVNLLSCNDFKQKTNEIEQVIVDVTNWRHIRGADYFLEIKPNVNTTDGLDSGVWLPIKNERHPKALINKNVIALMEENGNTVASVRTFVQAKDHYFLQSKSDKVASIVVVHYASDLEKIEGFYKGNVVIKRAHEVQICGPVHYNKRFSQLELRDMVTAYIWRVPVIQNIAAGLPDQ